MKQVCVISGKGGTGKSSLTASFGKISTTPVVLADCDVDGANLALFFNGNDEEGTPFMAGTRARIDLTKCTKCGGCRQVCRYSAIDSDYIVNPLQCEGCNACTVDCPSDAIVFQPNRAGTLLRRETPHGPLVHAELGVAQDNSGKLVAEVRNRARTLAKAKGIDLILIDGPPGIGCPVHASLTGVDVAVIVTEPSVSGLHDLKRVLQLCRHFQIDTKVIINKWDLGKEATTRISACCEAADASIVGQIPFDRQVPIAQCNGTAPSDLKHLNANLTSIWQRIASSL